MSKENAHKEITKSNKPSLDHYVEELKTSARYTAIVEEAAANAERIIQDYDMIFYIAGALTGVTETTKKRYSKTSNLIASHSRRGHGMFGYAPHLHGTDPVKHPDVTPNEVHDIDKLFAVVVPDAHINFTDPLAHGNAIEAGWAEMAEIPMIYLTPRDQKLSRLVLGMRNIAQQIIYQDFDSDGIAQLDNYLGEIEAPSVDISL